MKLKPLHYYFGLFLFLLSMVAGTPKTAAQIPVPGTPNVQVTADTVLQDSAQVAMPKGDVETTIKYFSRDSTNFDVSGKIMHLYGEASIEYGTMSLKAAYIRIDWENNTLTAVGAPDSTGKTIGRPMFKDEEEYAADRIVYNYKTRKGRISGVETKQQEGFIHAETIKKNEHNEIFGLHARYTTCDLKHPHFYINAHKMKAIPKDRIISGPFNMVFADVPTPFGLPFGFFPSPDKRASGFIMPTFGETRERGFFLRNGGYYLALNDYIGLRFTGDIYSFGGHAARVEGTYLKRYTYTGSFGLDYSFIPQMNLEGRSRTTNGLQRNLGERRDFRVRWSHRPTPRDGKSFSASVNAGTFFYNQNNSFVAAELLAPSFNSSVTYQVAKPNSPWNYTVSLNQSQNSQTRTMSFTLPDFTLGLQRQNPFQWITNENAPDWLRDFAFSYQFNGRQFITNNLPDYRDVMLERDPNSMGMTPINRENLGLLFDEAQVTARHSLPITLSSFRIFKHLQLSPGVNYGESWYLKRKEFVWNPETNKVEEEEVQKFSRVYDYSASASLNTRIYGTKYIKGKKVEAIRHIITPSVSYSWRPDFTKKNIFGQEFDYYQYVQVDSIGHRYEFRPRYDGVPGIGKSSIFSFSIDNNLEMKVRSTKKDTTDTDTETDAKAFEKIRLIDFFRLSSGYNVAAKEFKLQIINASFSTMLFNKVNISANATFDPYQVDGEGRRINKYYFNLSKLQLARMQQANISANFELNPKAREESNTAPPSNLPHLDDSPLAVQYLDFDIPWTLSVQTTAAFFPATTGATTMSMNVRNPVTLGFNGSLSLTEKWKVSYNSGFDFVNNTLSYTNLSIHRDLHCWEMNFSWVPFGRIAMYSFNINAKASLLRDLKYTRNRAPVDRW